MLNLDKEAAKDIEYCHPYLQIGSQGWGVNLVIKQEFSTMELMGAKDSIISCDHQHCWPGGYWYCTQDMINYGIEGD